MKQSSVGRLVAVCVLSCASWAALGRAAEVVPQNGPTPALPMGSTDAPTGLFGQRGVLPAAAAPRGSQSPSAAATELPTIPGAKPIANPFQQKPPVAPQVGPRARIPGEFEKHEALLLATTGLTATFPDLFLDIVSAIHARIQVVALVGNRTERDLVVRLLRQRGLAPNAVRRLQVPHDTMWIRDYGPIFVTGQNPRRVAVDAEYIKLGRPLDDQVPSVIARWFRATAVRAPLDLDGGNLQSNGQGLLVTTTATLAVNNDRGRDEAAVRQLLAQYCGGAQVVILEPLTNEPTGHVDMFMAFTAPDSVVVGKYDPLDDPLNADLLDRNAARLARVVTADGKPLRVSRVPMPPHDDSSWRTYTNVIFANGALLVPVYPGIDPDGQEAALSTLRRLLPRWQVVAIDANELIPLGGGLRCISMNVPVDQRAIAPRGGPRPLARVGWETILPEDSPLRGMPLVSNRRQR